MIENAQLIRRVEEQAGEPTFSFKHALVQDTAYASLLKQDRQALHRLVGQTLEQMYPEQKDTFAPLLAHHFDLAGDDDKAFEYACRAGEVSSRIYANAEAVTHFTHALELAEANKVTDAERVKSLYLKRGRALELAGRYQEALDNYSAMGEWAARHESAAVGLEALLARSTLHATFTPVYDPERGRALAEQALAVAHELGDRRAQAKALWNLELLAIYGQGDPEAAIAYGEKGLALARQLHWQEQAAFILNDLFYPYLQQRPASQARAIAGQALELWQELGMQPMVTDALANGVVSDFLMGEYDRALATSARAAEIGRTTGSSWGQSYAQMYTGYIHWERGDPENAIGSMVDSILLGEQGGFGTPQVITRADLGWLYAQLGYAEHGLELAQQAVTKAERDLELFGQWAMIPLARIQIRTGDLDGAHRTLHEGPFRVGSGKPHFMHPQVVAPLALARAELAARHGDYQAADSYLWELLEYLNQREIRAYLPEALLLRARVLGKQGDLANARICLEHAEQAAVQFNANWSLWRILGERARVTGEQGETAHATELYTRAGTILQSIAARTPEPLRVLLLRTPDARAVSQGLART